jgi:hypothetical protein
MSVLLQSIWTSKYVEDGARWTDYPNEALQFNGATEALFYCYKHRLKHMQVLGQFDDPGKNFTIPLTDERVEAD